MPFHNVYRLSSIVYRRKKLGHLLLTINDQRLRGFTLIEFLIVIGILSISMGSVLLFLTSTIKGTNQANITAEVKQNGQAVLEALERQLRSSTEVVTLIDTQLPLPYNISGNNGIQLKKTSGEYVYIICANKVSTTTNGSIRIASNTTGSPPNASADYQSLTADTDLVSGVDIDCTAGTPPQQAFRVDTATSSVNVVTISFAANQAVNAPSRVDFKANAKFQTVISLRQF